MTPRDCSTAKRVVSFPIRCVLIFCYIYSLATGLTALRFDFRTHKIVKSRLISLYVACANIAVIATMPFVFYTGLAYTQSIEDNELLITTDAINTAIRFAVVVLTMVFRWRRERGFQEMAEEFVALIDGYFKRQPVDASMERRFEFVLFMKFFTSTSQVVIGFVSMLQMARQSSINALFIAMLFAHIQSVLHIVMFHYFTALWYVCKCFAILNMQLKQLLVTLEQLHANGGGVLHRRSFTLEQLSRLAAADLREMSHVHWRLTNLVLHWNDSFKYQVMAVLLTYLINNVAYGFYAVLMANGTLKMSENSDGNYSTFSLIFGCFSCFIFFTDLYLLYWACDAAAGVHQRAAVILKEFQSLPLMDEVFQRHCEAFSLQLMQSKLSINIGGMFTLNMSSSLAMWSYTLRHTLILVQFDYENRFRRFKASVAMEIDNSEDFI